MGIQSNNYICKTKYGDIHMALSYVTYSVIEDKGGPDKTTSSVSM